MDTVKIKQVKSKIKRPKDQNIERSNGQKIKRSKGKDQKVKRSKGQDDLRQHKLTW